MASLPSLLAEITELIRAVAGHVIASTLQFNIHAATITLRIALSSNDLEELAVSDFALEHPLGALILGTSHGCVRSAADTTQLQTAAAVRTMEPTRRIFMEDFVQIDVFMTIIAIAIESKVQSQCMIRDSLYKLD